MSQTAASTQAVGEYLLAKNQEEFRFLDEKLRLFEQMLGDLETAFHIQQLRNHVNTTQYERD